MQGLLGLGGFLLGAVADHGVALSQVQVEGDERPVLQTQRPQGGAVDLIEEAKGAVTSFPPLLPGHSSKKMYMAPEYSPLGKGLSLQGLSMYDFMILTFHTLSFTMNF